MLKRRSAHNLWCMQTTVFVRLRWVRSCAMGGASSSLYNWHTTTTTILCATLFSRCAKVQRKVWVFLSTHRGRSSCCIMCAPHPASTDYITQITFVKLLKQDFAIKKNKTTPKLYAALMMRFEGSFTPRAYSSRFGSGFAGTLTFVTSFALVRGYFTHSHNLHGVRICYILYKILFSALYNRSHTHIRYV